MTKKEVGGLQQQALIEGSVDDVPKEVLDKVDEYVKQKRKKEKVSAVEYSLREEVIGLMEKHSVEQVPIDGGKMLVLKHMGKVDIKKRKAPPEAQAPEEEDSDD